MPARVPEPQEVVAQFIREEQGKISKQSVLTIGAILATLGLATTVSPTHLCGGEGSVVGVSGGDGDGSSGECENGSDADCGEG